MSGPKLERRGGGRNGYALVALIVIVAVMNVLVAASLPYWSQIVKRDKEAELIFRGLQYAEAIRVFQKRFNRLPNTLDELVEVNPRSIRQLWKDPMTDDGEWEPIRAQEEGGGGGRGRARRLAGGTAPRDSSAREQERDGRRRRRAVGPIIGVRSRSKGEASRKFMGSSSYSSWRFTVEVIPTPVAIPDTLLIPRPTSDWVGRPFREDLQPKQGKAPARNPAARRRNDDDG